MQITVNDKEYEYDEETMRRCYSDWLDWTGNSESDTCYFEWFLEAAYDERSFTYISVSVRHFREIWEYGRMSVANAEAHRPEMAKTGDNDGI